jgi:hypothetical protein
VASLASSLSHCVFVLSVCLPGRVSQALVAGSWPPERLDYAYLQLGSQTFTD